MSRAERRHKRVHLPMVVHVSFLNTDQPDALGTLYDLSAGGCAFYMQQEIPIGERIQIRIVLAELLARKFMKTELTARGAICRIERHEEKYLLGVRFFK